MSIPVNMTATIAVINKCVIGLDHTIYIKLIIYKCVSEVELLLIFSLYVLLNMRIKRMKMTNRHLHKYHNATVFHPR
jgi:hypothetical protein